MRIGFPHFGNIYIALNSYPKAEKLVNRILESYEATLTNSDPAKLNMMDQLAEIYYNTVFRNGQDGIFYYWQADCPLMRSCISASNILNWDRDKRANVYQWRDDES